MKAKLKSKLNLENHVPLQDVIPLTTPFLLYIDPSSACNFQCLFCPSGHKDIIKKSNTKPCIMTFDLFKKIIDNLEDFEKPIKVLRMNKIGEPLLNKNLPEMIAYAKNSGKIEFIDLASNASLFTHENMIQLRDARLDRLNISIEGINRDQYLKYAGVDIDFDGMVKNIKWFYKHKGSTEITIKIPSSYITEEEEKEFFNIFGNYCDRIFIEDIAPIWPGFDIEVHSKIKLKKTEGQYKQTLKEKKICTYIFYSLAINADGSVSACCPDWGQELIVGNINKTSLKNIWNSNEINALRKQHLEGKRHMNAVCSQCGHIKYCQLDDIDLFAKPLLKKIK